MTTLPEQRDWEIYRGDSASRIYGYGLSSGPILSLDGWSALMQVRAKVDGEVWLSKTDADDIELTLTAEGKILCKIPVHPDDTADWTSKRSQGVWDVQLTSPEGNVRTLAFGRFRVTGDVSKVGP